MTLRSRESAARRGSEGLYRRNAETEAPPAMPPPRPRHRFELQKVFLLDPQGGYTGEMVLVEDCVVEYSDFLAAVPQTGLGDGQSVFLGEYMATLLQGERMGLVAVYKGTAEPDSI